MTGIEKTAAFQVVLPARSTSVGEARHLLRERLDGLPTDVAETAELLVSELVTNALVHAGTPITMRVARAEGGLRVEISDGSPHHPAPRTYTAMAGTGRGLVLLQELVDAWGVEGTAAGKTVWFELGSVAGRGSDHGDVPAAPPGAVVQPGGAEGAVAATTDEPAAVRVRLLNMPLLLHEAWHQHVEALLREHLLVTLDGPPAADEPVTTPDPIQVHADVSDALSLLSEQVPRADVGEDDPKTVMAAAVEPRVSAAQTEVLVPADSVDHFATLDRTVAEAVVLADAGLTLTAPTQPEVRELRRWLCREVARQSQGADPTPWEPGDAPPPTAGPPLEWDGSSVSFAPTGQLAMDDANCILAVSRGAAEILGYEPSALVGQRVLALIPKRYRQAHLAGFTLHFLTGRQPLIDRAVTVPALRPDGSEVLIELTVHRESAPEGRTVFLADVALAG